MSSIQRGPRGDLGIELNCIAVVVLAFAKRRFRHLAIVDVLTRPILTDNASLLVKTRGGGRLHPTEAAIVESNTELR